MTETSKTVDAYNMSMLQKRDSFAMQLVLCRKKENHELQLQPQPLPFVSTCSPSFIFGADQPTISYSFLISLSLSLYPYAYVSFHTYFKPKKGNEFTKITSMNLFISPLRSYLNIIFYLDRIDHFHLPLSLNW